METTGTIGPRVKRQVGNSISQPKDGMNNWLSGGVNDFMSMLRGKAGNGVEGLSNSGDPSQDDAEEKTFRGLGNAGRSAFRSGMFGRGGIVRKPTVALVGEKGPEAIVPLTNKRRMRSLADTLQQMQGGKR